MNRRKARQLALRLSFSAQFQSDVPANELLSDYTENGGENDEYAEKLFLGIEENLVLIDAKISSLLKGWKLERISRISLAILRLSVYEILYTETPDSVVANEAVELAKEYADVQDASFINGVIANVIKSKNEDVK